MGTIKNNTGALALLSLLGSLTACGSAENNIAPEGSSIVINPASHSVTLPSDAGPGCVPTAVDTPIEITVRDANDVPLNGITIWVSLSFSAGTVTNTDLHLMELYDGVEKKTSPYETHTVSAGTKNLTVRMLGGCSLPSYDGEVSVYSGAVYQSSDKFSMSVK